MTILEGPKQKIRRAGQHIAELQRVLNDYIAQVPCRISADEGFLTMELGQQFPTGVPLLIGDAAHNLRSALDIAICELVRLSGGTPTRRTQFPFSSSQKELQLALRGEGLKRLRRPIANLIINTVRSYKGGNDQLYSLHELDIMDKHRLVIPVAVATALVGVHASSAGGVITNCTFTVDGYGSGKYRMVAAPGDIEIIDYGTPAIDVRFAEGQPFASQAVIPTMHQLTSTVSSVVMAMEHAYEEPL